MNCSIESKSTSTPSRTMAVGLVIALSLFSIQCGLRKAKAPPPSKEDVSRIDSAAARSEDASAGLQMKMETSAPERISKGEEPAAAEPNPAHEKLAPHWSYSGLLGPENWSTIDERFQTCRDGKSQSPVDLRWQKPVKGGDIEFAYKTSPISIIDNGHTVQVNVAPGNFVKIRGKEFELKQFHFHAGSEHTLSKKRFPLEVHLVHKNPAGEIAKIGVFFVEGRTNELIGRLWEQIPEVKNVDTEVSSFHIHPQALIPPKLTYYHYMGSLTTPPCSEGVNWNVFNSPIELSKAQLAAFTALYSGNYRPLQDLKGRKLVNF